MGTGAIVLVVEDDIHLLAGIRDILALEKYRVLTAQNGKQGLDILEQDPDNPPNVIVSDIMMPEMDGFELLEKVREEDRWVTVPFIFLTAKGEKTDRHRGKVLGADVYLTKPFEADELIISVAATLKRYDAVKRVTKDEISGVKDNILTILNHEFRTPLTLVVAYADMLKDFDGKNMNNANIMDYLQGVNSGATRLKRLVENFMLLVEFDNSNVKATVDLKKETIQSNFESLIQDAYVQVKEGPSREREFTFDVAEDFLPITVDRTSFVIVLRELFDNAIKFSDINSHIEVKAFIDGDDAVISVTDHGRGIPASEIDKIWEPFYQFNRKNFEDQGSGSGLTIVNELIKVHGGTCSVESQIGKGSCFTIRLPRG